ncbi:hypothetical protein U9M48_009345 [Paspalum notatum var. saurae]|uniref:Reverse transcriptase Ty1/copia-type domain-containing protein n=1 Tax=Paspalum notatum var. saurae TaxID=547442 RepID=A0AAQ3SR24_PASNO
MDRGAGEATGDEVVDVGEVEENGGGEPEQEAPADSMSPPSPLPVEQGTPMSAEVGGSMRFITLPPGAEEHLDTEYNDEPFRFRTVDNILGDASLLGQAVRELDEQLFLASTEEPPTLETAAVDVRWWRAMKEKMTSIKENKTWELVNVQTNRAQVKKNECGNVVKHKARLMAKGFMQREGIDFEEVFAPVARMDSVRLLLALGSHEGLERPSSDVKSAFLNGELTEAPRAWNVKLDTTLATLRFKKYSSELTLYTRRSKEGILIVRVYVDDLIEIKKFKSEMATKFKMKVRQRKQAIELCQSAYALQLLEKARLKGCNPTQVPMQEKPKLSTAEKVDATHYRSLVGGLRYLTRTRPDITFVMGYVSRFMEEPRKDHIAAVKHLLRYIVGTCTLGLAYPQRKKTNDLHLFGFSDREMGGDIDGRKSTSGMVFLLETCPCEAEYISDAAATCHGIWQWLLEEITRQAVATSILRLITKQPLSWPKTLSSIAKTNTNSSQMYFSIVEVEDTRDRQRF